MTTYNDFESYLETLVEAIDGLKSLVIVTDWADILDLQLDQAKYPALVVECPDVEMGDDGGLSLSFDFAFSVVRNAKKDEKPAFYRSILNDTLTMAIQVREKIYCDSEMEMTLHDAELGTQFQRIVAATPDNVYGWRGSAVVKYFTSI